FIENTQRPLHSTETHCGPAYGDARNQAAQPGIRLGGVYAGFLVHFLAHPDPSARGPPTSRYPSSDTCSVLNCSSLRVSLSRCQSSLLSAASSSVSLIAPASKPRSNSSSGTAISAS